MKDNINNSRRNALKWGLSVSGAILALSPVAKAIGNTCEGKTPEQPEGPFYPVHDQLDKDNDLTIVTGKTQKALGQIIYIKGILTDDSCQPVKNVLVEIWQACHTGKYNHPGDPNTAKLDPNFQYWGKCVTNEKGEYLFKTILPGAYPAGDGWIRPPHIHYKVSGFGFKELITQMYFVGNEELNNKDLILKKLNASDKNKVVVELKEPPNDFEPESKVGTFNISLEKVKSI
jgi:protocatechuate 3,4-dioxygenase beta subunit